MRDPALAPDSRSPLQTPAVSVARMQAIDAAAIDTLGIPRVLLMEHAGLAVARTAQRMLPSASAAPITICAGLGYNGGDGLAAARHLRQGGYTLRLVLAGSRARLREEPAVFATMLERGGVALTEYEPSRRPDIERWMAGSGLLIDALLGIGARGEVREPIASLIASLNRAGRPILAVDIPSGLDADTGAVQGLAVNATTTVTFGLPKQGCFLRDGPGHTGTLLVDPIGFPPTLLHP